MKQIANKHSFGYPYNGILLNLDDSQMPYTKWRKACTEVYVHHHSIYTMIWRKNPICGFPGVRLATGGNIGVMGMFCISICGDDTTVNIFKTYMM